MTRVSSLVGLFASLVVAHGFTLKTTVADSSRSLTLCHGALADSSVSSSSSSSATISSTTPAIHSFTTPPLPLYIEDTDAYGVKYNANYLRTFERALHWAQLQRLKENDDDNADATIGTSHIFPSTTNWSIRCVDEIKLRQAPSLGQEYVIRGTFVGGNDDSAFTWDLDMTSPAGTIVYSTAKGITIQCMLDKKETSGANDDEAPNGIPVVEPQNQQEASPSYITHMDMFHTFRDEYDPIRLPHHLPLYSILKFMERARSNWIGGPDALRQLQEGDGVLYVVTRIRDLQLIMHDDMPRLIPGNTQVTIRTDFTAKKRGMMVECQQTALVDDKPIAEACVSIMAVDASTWRPTNKLPEWFMQKLTVE